MSERSSIRLPKIYPLTDTRLSGLSHSRQVELLIAGGSTFIQLREKTAGARGFYDEVLASLDIARRSEATIIVNDRVDIALAAGAHGVHLGRHDLSASAARKLLGPSAIIGVSTHSEEQFAEALTLPVDYIAFGPVFPTATKRDPDPVVGIAALRRVRAIAAGFPVVAIGGISAFNLNEALQNGADSAALISSLFVESESISDRFAALSATANSVKHL